VGTSLRTDSYIHSRDCYKRCLQLLRPDGIFLLSFGASVNGDSDWLRDRIYKTITDAAGYNPVFMSDESAPVKWPAYVFITGERVRRGEIVAPHDPTSYSGKELPKTVDAKVLTDDWPYLYIRPTAIDSSYMLVLLEVVAIAMFAGRNIIFGRKTGSDIQLFFLGAAFILLELQSISRLSLLYGTTWLTSSIVINGVLLMILGANFLILKFGPVKKQEILYIGLVASLLLSYFLPVEQTLTLNGPTILLGHIAVTFVTLLPMFMAGLIFASAFAGVKTAARSFGFNLLGTVFGALLEYLSTYFGINAMVLVALLMYGFSFAGYLFSKDEPQSEPTPAAAPAEA
jgi:hypothetical protein